MWRYAIGIGVPFLSVMAVPVLGHLPLMLLGVPLALIWLFCCIPITSLCLYACWHFGDRHRDLP